MQTQGKPSTGRKRVVRWVRRILAILLILLVLVVGALFAFTSIADATAYAAKPTGSLLVDAGGRKVHLRVLGKDKPGPAVVLLSGFAGSIAGGHPPDSGWWAAVQPPLANTTRVYTFDYAGFGWSDPASPSHISAADDLHAALDQLGESRVILVGFATGSNTVFAFYNRYKAAVAGIVLLDGDALTPEDVENYTSGGMTSQMASVMRTLIGLGAGRIYYHLALDSDNQVPIARWLPENVPFDREYYQAVNATRSTRKVLTALIDWGQSYRADVRFAVTLPLPKDVPIFAVRTGGEPDWDLIPPDYWQRLKQSGIDRDTLRAVKTRQAGWDRALAEGTPGGKFLFLENTAHLMMIQRPDVVVKLIQDMQALVSAPRS